jgi:hypothetical protein
MFQCSSAFNHSASWSASQLVLKLCNAWPAAAPSLGLFALSKVRFAWPLLLSLLMMAEGAEVPHVGDEGVCRGVGVVVEEALPQVRIHRVVEALHAAPATVLPHDGGRTAVIAPQHAKAVDPEGPTVCCTTGWG